jgi:RNA polymerase sigma factor (sigma-70 family)
VGISQSADHIAAFAKESGHCLLDAAYRLCHDRYESEDLVQDAYERLLRHLAAHDPPDDWLGYTTAIIRNTYLSEHRRLRWSRESALDETAGHTAARPDESAAVVERSALRAALDRLPPRQRSAVALRHLHDLSLAQVAERLGCTAGTAAGQVSRGLDKLRLLVEP